MKFKDAKDKNSRDAFISDFTKEGFKKLLMSAGRELILNILGMMGFSGQAGIIVNYLKIVMQKA